MSKLYERTSVVITTNLSFSEWAQDGRLGNDFIEVKTITPFKARDFVTISSAGNFSKLFVVKINEDFEIAGRMVERKALPWNGRDKIRIKWNDLAS